MRKAPAKEPETVQKIWGVNQLSVQPSQLLLDDVVGSEVEEAILESTAVFLDSKCKIEGFENEFSICDDIDY